ncbi:ABC transporter substrate-binding protein [Aquincola sp. S2]|uniref:ABC transporter substrate-binding protein n=1 Tax=Pseudaquabacterium terrae TaxID=2732868 RepID=A0ABX2EQR6_9BURK|nr:ABC transporter substrate-binding protein [Aquabacterium terrae]NRF71015.1 ABC transporter substrate-binding protein [Aquabacterium terrae]
MKHREIMLRILVAGTILLPVVAVAQQSEKITLGFLGAGPAPTLAAPDPLLQTFRQSLAAHGYVDGRDVIIETRWAGGQLDQLPALAAEMVRLRVDIIVGVGAVAVRAAKSATTTIPVVFEVVIDPVANGLVASLERPGGNLTGLTTFDPQEARKKLELLKEVLPGLARVALLGDQALRDSQGHEEQARALGLQPQSLKIAGASPDLEDVFQAIRKESAGALLVLAQPATAIHRRRIAEMAAKHRLPTLFSSSGAGGLIEFGTSLVEVSRRMATYVDRILKGAKPADLPVEVVIRQELVVNLSIAREIGVTIPPEVLKRADRVIQ